MSAATVYVYMRACVFPIMDESGNGRTGESKKNKKRKRKRKEKREREGIH